MTAPGTVLVMSQSTTLAHVARGWVLARVLSRHGYDVHFLESEFAPLFSDWNADPPIHKHRLESDSKAFLARVKKNKPVLDHASARRSVLEDLELMDRVRPDVVVGDSRFSLAVSSKVKAIPYLSVSNAYWSPYARQTFVLPGHPLTRWLGESWPNRWTSALALSLIARVHTRGIRRVAREFGITPIAPTFQDLVTQGDWNLYVDLPTVVPLSAAPENHVSIGPVQWAPDQVLPEWWPTIDTGRPVVYVSLGSSGSPALLTSIADALQGESATVLVATVDSRAQAFPRNFMTAPYLPGDLACRRARLAITNGGSMSMYQALQAGTPVLGLIHNIDQYLNMQFARRTGAVEFLFPHECTPRRIGESVRSMLRSDAYTTQARQLGQELQQLDAGKNFLDVVTRFCPRSTPAAPARGVS